MNTLHMMISVRGLLKMGRREQKRFAKGFLIDGKPCQSVEAMTDQLLDLLAMGYEVLPLGKGCEGFDKVNGCPGHEEKGAA